MTDINTRSMGWQGQVSSALPMRSFIKGSLALVGAVIPAVGFNATHLESRQIGSKAAGAGWGLVLIYGEGSLDLVDLDAGLLLHTITGLRATHVVTPVQTRFPPGGHQTGAPLNIRGATHDGINGSNKGWASGLTALGVRAAIC